MTRCVHFHFDSIGSTNSWAKEHSQELNRTLLTVITADQQTHGRGRYKRLWHSPSGGNLYASFCYFLCKAEDWMHSAQILALSLCQVLEGYQAAPLIKWPNDLFLNGQKCGGLLTETIELGAQRLVVHGLGLNVKHYPIDFEDDREQPATSLEKEGIAVPQAVDLAFEIGEAFLEKKEILLKHGLKPFIPDLRARQALREGDLVWVRVGEQWRQGVYQALRNDGFLDVLTHGEKPTAVSVLEISRRPRA